MNTFDLITHHFADDGRIPNNPVLPLVLYRSGIHLAAVLFEHMAEVKLGHVPYRGTGPALTDLIGGHVSMYFSSLPAAVSIVKDGKAHWVDVVTGLRGSAGTEIVSPALTASDQVVVSGQVGLPEGASVTIRS